MHKGIKIRLIYPGGQIDTNSDLMHDVAQQIGKDIGDPEAWHDVLRTDDGIGLQVQATHFGDDA